MEEGTRPLLRQSLLWGLEEVHELQIFLVKGIPLVEIRRVLVAPSMAKPEVALDARAEEVLKTLQAHRGPGYELGISRGTASTGVVRSENRFLFHAQAQRPKIERARSRRINSIAARSSPIPLLSFWRMKSDFIMAVTQRARPVRTITRMSAALAW